MTALTPELAGALSEVTRLLDDTVREVRMEHGRIVFKLERHMVKVDPQDASWSVLDTAGRTFSDVFAIVDAATYAALTDLAAEVEHWCSERLAQAVEDTDWTPGRTEATTLERCECGEHRDCPDGWHHGDDLPCPCTPDCALDRDGAS